MWVDRERSSGAVLQGVRSIAFPGYSVVECFKDVLSTVSINTFDQWSFFPSFLFLYIILVLWLTGKHTSLNSTDCESNDLQWNLGYTSKSGLNYITISYIMLFVYSLVKRKKKKKSSRIGLQSPWWWITTYSSLWNFNCKIQYGWLIDRRLFLTKLDGSLRLYIDFESHFSYWDFFRDRRKGIVKESC